MRSENFIYFFTVSGFFIGLIFATIKDLDVENFLFATLLVTAIFYIIAIATVGFFVKYLDLKKIIYISKSEIDEILDMQIRELEKKEDFIYENYEFIKQVEEEELEILRRRNAAKK